MSAPDLLTIRDLRVRYGAVQAVRGIDIEVPEGAVVALIGPNGAGKTSVLRALGGQERSTGSVVFRGDEISRWKSHKVSSSGIAQVLQGRRLFPELTVEENLLIGGWRRPASERSGSLETVYTMFPRLRERMHQQAASMSGGEQQMVAIGRALMRSPKLVTMDEPSLGLAPIIVKEMFETIARIRESGVSVLLVEQNAAQTLHYSDYVYVLNRGRLVYQGPSKTAIGDLDVVSAYMH